MSLHIQTDTRLPPILHSSTCPEKASLDAFHTQSDRQLPPISEIFKLACTQPSTVSDGELAHLAALYRKSLIRRNPHQNPLPSPPLNSSGGSVTLPKDGLGSWTWPWQRGNSRASLHPAPSQNDPAHPSSCGRGWDVENTSEHQAESRRLPSKFVPEVILGFPKKATAILKECLRNVVDRRKRKRACRPEAWEVMKEWKIPPERQREKPLTKRPRISPKVSTNQKCCNKKYTTEQVYFIIYYRVDLRY
ncbi:hypothetical protein B0H66DRAFT_208042 [Apodospora peruviana]|uniref:Uncharacterized protein n=1 Tax=Apodospora peruviana TaxID=516989 RepID=A0AAE0ICQ1_9PEZI|nr:hypothetical protein B0H66DRAFT_208042 [Apodospora peruviana]